MPTWVKRSGSYVPATLSVKRAGAYASATPFVKSAGAYGGSGGSGGSGTIGGVALGASGAGVFTGFRLQAGDEFDSAPSRWSGSVPAGRYSSGSPASGQHRINTSSAQQFYLEPQYRGVNSESPVDLGYDAITTSGSVATITAQPTPAGLLPYLPGNYPAGLGDGSNKPLLVSGCLDTWPSFTFSAAGDWAIACRIRQPAGVARGWWPAFWCSTLFNWPDYGEVDVMEGIKAADGSPAFHSYIHVSTTDGGGDSAVPVLFNQSLPAGQWVTYVARKIGNNLRIYHDIATPGTLALIANYTDARVGRLRGAHRIRMELAVAQLWDGSTFNIADWPKSIEFDWWQYWSPSAAYTDYVPPAVLTPINTAPGGSWATTLPSVVSLYGAAPAIEECVAAFDNIDTPGQETKANGLPGGMSVDLATRAITGTVPSNRGGRVGLILAGSFAAGGQAKQALLYYNVAPAAQSSLFSNFAANYAETFSKSIAYTDFHSGNLGPHTYSVSNNSGGWLSVSYGANNQSVTLSGTSPSTDQTVTITINVTNAIGQTTTVTRTCTVSATTFTFTDNFNRSNQTLETSSNWTRVGGVAGDANITANVLRINTSDSVGALYRSPDLGGGVKQYVQAKLRATSAFIVLQATDANNWVGLRRNPSTNVAEVYTRIAGTLSLQAAFTTTLSDTSVARLEHRNGVLTVLKDGVVLTPSSGSLTLSSAPPASTRTGVVVRVNFNNDALDDYEAGTLA